jgi:hypothetical protein
MAMRNPVGRANYQPNSFSEVRGNRRKAASRLLPMSNRGPSAGCARRALQTTTAKRGSSSSARP